MSDGVDARQLLEAVRRRGGYRARDPRYGDFETTRTTSIWTGAVFPQQQVTLRRTAMLILGVRGITIGIDTDAKRIEFTPQEFRGPPTPAEQERLEQMVFQVLGSGWKVSCAGNLPGNAESMVKVPRVQKGNRRRNTKKAKALRRVPRR